MVPVTKTALVEEALDMVEKLKEKKTKDCARLFGLAAVHLEDYAKEATAENARAMKAVCEAAKRKETHDSRTLLRELVELMERIQTTAAQEEPNSVLESDALKVAKRLRNKTSHGNRKLLDDGAWAIETMVKELQKQKNLAAEAVAALMRENQKLKEGMAGGCAEEFQALREGVARAGAERDEARRELKEAAGTIKTLRSDLKIARAKLSELEKDGKAEGDKTKRQIEDLDRMVSGLTEENERLELRNKELAGELGEAMGQLRKVTEELEDERAWSEKMRGVLRKGNEEKSGLESCRKRLEEENRALKEENDELRHRKKWRLW